MPPTGAARFFATPAAFRRWLEKNHAAKRELWVGFHKRASGKPSITWPESVDEALCFGWIDGVRKNLDETSYVIRFTPRGARSTWSAVNLGRIEELTREGRVHPAGAAALASRGKEKAYSYEQRTAAVFEPAEEQLLRSNRRAWTFFEAQPPWYRRTTTFWVTSAKKPETRTKRLATLIADCEQERWIGAVPRAPKGKA